METQAESTYLRPGLRLVGILVSQNLSDGSVQPTPISSGGKKSGRSDGMLRPLSSRNLNLMSNLSQLYHNENKLVNSLFSNHITNGMMFHCGTTERLYALPYA